MNNILHDTKPLEPIAVFPVQHKVTASGRKANSFKPSYAKLTVLSIFLMTLFIKAMSSDTQWNNKKSGEGSIVIIDNDLVVTAPSVTQAISGISIKSISDESETEIGGCFENKCMYSFSSYPKGTYLITVYSDSGNFWGYVTK